MFPLMNADSFTIHQPVTLSAQPQLCAVDCSWKPLLEAVRNDKLQFREQEISIRSSNEYIRPVGGGLPPIPELRIRTIIENPPELVQLSNVNDIRIFDELLRLLNYPDRAWAANILLGKMMGLPPISIEVEVLHNLSWDNGGTLKYKSKRVSPIRWWETEGKTLHAKKAWITYLRKVKSTMKWHKVEVEGHNYSYFRHIMPNGLKVL
jgi:hypothetical protein